MSFTLSVLAHENLHHVYATSSPSICRNEPVLRHVLVVFTYVFELVIPKHLKLKISLVVERIIRSPLILFYLGGVGTGVLSFVYLTLFFLNSGSSPKD